MVGDRGRCVQDGIGQHDRELFSAVARRGVLAFDVLLDRHRHQPQHLVAGQMAVAVVESLEMIDVGHHQRELLVLRLRLGDGSRQRVVEILAVGKRGEGVGQAFGADGLQILLELHDLLR